MRDDVTLVDRLSAKAANELSVLRDDARHDTRWWLRAIADEVEELHNLPYCVETDGRDRYAPDTAKWLRAEADR